MLGIYKNLFFNFFPKHQIKKSYVLKDKQDVGLLYPTLGDARTGLVIFDINLGLT